MIKMNNRYVMVVLMIFLVGCSPYKQFNVFNSYSKVTLITVSKYKPLYSSTLPDLINTVTSLQDVKEIMSIINRSYDKNETISNEAIFSNPNLFDFQLGFEGDNLPLTQLFVQINDNQMIVSAMVLNQGSETEYKVYEIQEKDVEVFKGFLK